MTRETGADSVLRAMTNDGAFRVVTTRTTSMVQETLDRQDARGAVAAQLGELLTGAVLIRETMAPKQRLQGLFHDGSNQGRLVADTHPDGGTRGLLQLEPGASLTMRGGRLEMMRTLYNGELHRGQVEVPEGGGMSQALMAYMASSEQTATMVAVGCVMHEGRVRAAGGYLVQLLPEVGRAPLAIMTERLRDFENIDGLLDKLDAAPEPLLAELLYGMDYEKLEERPLSFKCRCSSVRVITSLTTLGKDELKKMIDENKIIDLCCEYCGQDYRVAPEQLKGLLEES